MHRVLGAGGDETVLVQAMCQGLRRGQETGAQPRALRPEGERGDDAAPVAADDAPIVASPGAPRLLLPVRTTQILLALQPDLPRLAAACRRHGYLGCFAYASSPLRDRATARMFAPAIGVGEDIVNANSTGCLAAHLYARFGHDRVEVEQGHVAGRPSLVLATAAATAEGIATRIGGTAVIRTLPPNRES